MLISQERLSSSLSRSEHRLALARHRKRRQQRILGLLSVLVLLVAGVWTAAKMAVRNPPPAPLLRVAWSSARLGNALVPSGATLLMRGGQPLLVSVENADAWRLWVQNGAATLSANRARWLPQQADTLTLGCRPVMSGWRVVGAPFSPRYSLQLNCLRAGRLDDGRLILRAPVEAKHIESALVSSRVRAGEGVAWDERALPLLEGAANEVAPAQKLPPGGALWTLARGFDSPDLAQDDATYAKLEDAHPANGSNAQTLAALARAIARREPTVSIKIVGGSMNGTGASGIGGAQNVTLSVLRLSFDGSGARDGWRKLPGQAKSESWRWWDEEN